MAGRIFGTDGIRGRAGEGWLAPEAVARLGQAAGAVLGGGKGGHALLGSDGRRSGPSFEKAMAGGLTAAGFEVRSAGLIPTPGLAWLARTENADLGAMISASHNPAEDNGIKLFSGQGDKLSDELQERIEDLLLDHGSDEPPAERVVPIDPKLELAYLDHLLHTAGKDLHLAGNIIALDCANGAGSRVGPRVLGRLGAQVHAIACEPDGDNINRECGSTHPEALQREVRSRGASIGIALDGDGDRCILVDERGAVVHGDGIMTVLARHEMTQGRMSDPRIVATVMSNRGLHRALRDVGVGVVEVAVGDRAVVESLRAEGLTLGGEQSGHVVLGGSNDYIGDGLYTALAVLAVMHETGTKLSELAAPYQPLPQVLLNVPVQRKPSLSELPEIAALVREVEQALGADGRVLLRYSGTEPLARVMVEGPDQGTIQKQAEGIAEAIDRALG